MKSFFLLEYLKLLNAVFITKIQKQLSISFVTALLQKRHGMEWFKLFFGNQLSLYDLAPEAVCFGFTEKHLDGSILQNHLLLVFKIYLHKLRSYVFVWLKSLLLEIKKD